MQTIISRAFPGRGHARVKEVRRVAAYRSTFMGNATREDAEIVLADLAAFSGFYGFTSADTPADQVKFSEGRRSVFGRVLGSLRMTDGELVQLEEAARTEALCNNKEFWK